MHHNYLKDLLTYRSLGLSARVYKSVGLEKSLRICLSNKGGTDAARPHFENYQHRLIRGTSRVSSPNYTVRKG